MAERPWHGRGIRPGFGAWLVASLFTLAACASDPAIVSWSARWLEAERLYEQDRHAEAEVALAEVESTALKRVDRTMVQMRRAWNYRSQGRHAEAIRAYLRAADGAARRMDRARARFDLAGHLESLGREDEARRLYRHLVRTYPEIMPGDRGLQRLEQIARWGGPAAMVSHIRWSMDVYPMLSDTTLADNLLYFAGRVAFARWRERGDPRTASGAEAMLKDVVALHPHGGLWDEALWKLSYLYEAQGRWDEAIVAIRRIQASREVSMFLGDYEHPFYWKGQLRVARIQLNVFDDPSAAAESYTWFLENYEKSRWRDDAFFWQACAWLRAGDAVLAEEAFQAIPGAYADSKYLRRLDAARAEPEGAVCDPKVFNEEAW